MRSPCLLPSGCTFSWCRRRSVKPRIARRGIESGQKLGHHRWKVERTFAWLHAYRRLLVRWERRADVHLGFLELACCLIAFRLPRPRFVRRSKRVFTYSPRCLASLSREGLRGPEQRQTRL